MLKHTSSRSDIRNIWCSEAQSDLDDSRDDLLLNLSRDTLDRSFTGINIYIS
jgi:hypothetical protein